jgi:hypothetical protein
VYSRAEHPLAQEGTYACLLGRGTTVALAKPSRYCCNSIGHVTLAGPIVAYTDSFHGVDSGCTSIAVVNVASRRTLLTRTQVACSVDAGFIAFGEVTDLVVTSRGSVAWIVHKGNQQVAGFEVHSTLTSGVTALLAEGPAIVPGSLRLSGHVVSWENAGYRKSGHLP